MQDRACRVSIGVPVFNGARFIAQSLQSILDQDMPDIEVVVSDNGSSDETPRICESFARRDARVRFFRQERNRGAAWNYNEVFRLASAPFFKWAAHDDRCEASYLRRCLEVFDASSASVVLVYPRTLLISDTGETLARYDDHLDIRARRPHRRIWHLTRWLAMCNAVMGVIRRDALERTRLIGSFPGSDQVLLAELALLGEFRQVPEYLFCRRRHADASRAANLTAAEVTAWFDPEARAELGLRQVLHREILRSIARAPFGPAERVCSAMSYLLGFAYRRTRVRIGATKRRLLGHSGRTRIESAR